MRPISEHEAVEAPASPGAVIGIAVVVLVNILGYLLF